MITVILLLCVSLSVFGLVAVLMPQTYSNELNSVLSRQTLNFIDELEMTALEDSGGLFDQFLENINIFSVELYDDNGQGITIPTMRGNEASASEMASSSARQKILCKRRQAVVKETGANQRISRAGHNPA